MWTGVVDNSTSREWSPAPAAVGCAWLGTAGAVAWCTALWLTGADPAGRVLAGIAAVGLGLAAIFGSCARPRLRADSDGLTVRGLFGSRHHPWPFVQEVRVLRIRRFGRDTSLLEVDTVTASGDERLLIFGRFDLAEYPEDVAPQVLALRP